MALKGKSERLVLRIYAREQGHALAHLSNPLLILIINVHCPLKAGFRALAYDNPCFGAGRGELEKMPLLGRHERTAQRCPFSDWFCTSNARVRTRRRW